MNSVCISSCINDTRDTRVPVRATYVNLYKWPESDAEFVRSVRRGGGVPAPRVVDSISCRQMYLRSYTFSREDDDDGNKKSKSETVTSSTTKTTSCLWSNKEEESDDVIVVDGRMKRRRKRRVSRRKKKKSSSGQVCSVMFRFFQRLLSCAATIDVVDPN